MNEGPSLLSQSPNFIDFYEDSVKFFQNTFNDVGFLEKWESIKDRTPLEYLYTFPDAPDLKRASILWYLTDGAESGVPDVFLKIWEKNRSEIPLSALITYTNSQPYDTCILWLLASAATKNAVYKSVLCDILMRMPGPIPSAVLSFQPKDEDKKLPALCDFLSNIELQLIEARNNYFQDPSTENAKLAFEAGYSPESEASFMDAFYVLGKHFAELGNNEKADQAYAMVPENSSHFDEVINYYAQKRDSRSLFEFVLKIKSDEKRVQSIQIFASYLQCIVPPHTLQEIASLEQADFCFEQFEMLKEIWTLKQENPNLAYKLPEKKTDLQLTNNINDEENLIMKNGPSLPAGFMEIYDELKSCFHDSFDPDAFLKKLEAIPDDNLAEYLYTAPQSEHLTQGSILFYLALYAENSPQAFLTVWSKIKDATPLSALLTLVDNGQPVDEDISTLWMLARRAVIDPNGDIKNVLLEILRLRSGVIPKHILTYRPPNKDGNHHRSLQEYFGELHKGIATIVNARNHFFRSLGQVEPNVLFENAKKADAAGYVNAFFDLGHYFSQQGADESADKAYSMLSETSPHYDEICVYFAKKDAIEDPINRISLAHLLQIKNNETRAKYIQAFASCYIYGKGGLEHDVVPPFTLKEMKGPDAVDFCFEQFVLLKEKHMLIEAKNNLIRSTEKKDSLIEELTRDEIDPSWLVAYSPLQQIPSEDELAARMKSLNIKI